MSAGLTWARNECDDQALSMKELSETFLKLKTQHQAQFGKPLKAVRFSRLTLLATLWSLPLMPERNDCLISTFSGVPVEIDDSLDLWEFKEVYA